MDNISRGLSESKTLNSSMCLGKLAMSQEANLKPRIECKRQKTCETDSNSLPLHYFFRLQGFDRKFQLSFINFFKVFGLTEPSTPQEIPIPSGFHLDSRLKPGCFIVTQALL